jgi:hypothetical protein
MNLIRILTAALVLGCAVGIAAVLGYAWSFTETTFGGYLGAAIPPLMVLCGFAAGLVLN